MKITPVSTNLYYNKSKQNSFSYGLNFPKKENDCFTAQKQTHKNMSFGGFLPNNLIKTLNPTDVKKLFESDMCAENIIFFKFLLDEMTQFPKLRNKFMFQALLPNDFIVKINNDFDGETNGHIFNRLNELVECKGKLKEIAPLLDRGEAVNWKTFINNDISKERANFIVENLYEIFAARQRLDSRPYPNWHQWAVKAKCITDYANCKIEQDNSFPCLLKNTAQAYSAIFPITENHGTYRTANYLMTRYNDSTGGYGEYSKRFDEILWKNRTSPYKDLALTRIVNINDEKGNIMLHPSKNNVDTAIKYAGKHYNEIREIVQKRLKKQNISIEELLQANNNIAAIHYILSNSVPFERGSAGIAGIITNSLKKATGIPVLPTKHNVALDLEAYCQSMPEYIENWFNFFEYRPEI